jgi:hypothetical protein
MLGVRVIKYISPYLFDKLLSFPEGQNIGKSVFPGEFCGTICAFWKA